MDIEKLTKSQIILLTLLVSFVTSIATGIVTVTLMDQAPADVTRTIDKVVERTVEKVVPGETKIIERIKEGGLSESEQVVLSVAAAQDALVLVSGPDISPRGGFIVSNTGTVLTKSSDLLPDTTYTISKYSDASTTTIPMKVIKIDQSLGVAFLGIVGNEKQSATDIISTAKSAPNTKLAYLELGNGTLSLGERVIALGLNKDTGPIVELGNVSSIVRSHASSTPYMITTIGYKSSLEGMPVLDLGGKVVGVVGKDADGGWLVYPDELYVPVAGSVLGVATSTVKAPSIDQ